MKRLEEDQFESRLRYLALLCFPIPSLRDDNKIDQLLLLLPPLLNGCNVAKFLFFADCLRNHAVWCLNNLTKKR